MGLYAGGLISGIIYSFENGWAYIRGGLKTGGGLKVRFCGIFKSSKYHMPIATNTVVRAHFKLTKLTLLFKTKAGHNDGHSSLKTNMLHAWHYV